MEKNGSRCSPLIGASFDQSMATTISSRLMKRFEFNIHKRMPKDFRSGVVDARDHQPGLNALDRLRKRR